jgi:single-stranded-DNA-specific exonuclease
MNLLTRDVPPRSAWALEQAGIHPLLARLYAARGVLSKDELDDALNLLLPPAGMLGTQEAAKLLADAMAQNKRLCIVADYDCDGATACAVGVRGLRMLGAKNVSYLVPDRVVDGYGLTPPIAERLPAWRVCRPHKRWACRCWSPTTICQAANCPQPTSSSTPTNLAAALPANPSRVWA